MNTGFPAARDGSAAAQSWLNNPSPTHFHLSHPLVIPDRSIETIINMIRRDAIMDSLLRRTMVPDS